MAEYIERDMLLKLISHKPSSPTTDREDRIIDGFISAVKNCPAADVRPVVLCKDCVYLSYGKYGAWCFNNYEANLKDDDFCSHGKRKEKQT